MQAADVSAVRAVPKRRPCAPVPFLLHTGFHIGSGSPALERKMHAGGLARLDMDRSDASVIGRLGRFNAALHLCIVSLLRRCRNVSFEAGGVAFGVRIVAVGTPAFVSILAKGRELAGYVSGTAAFACVGGLPDLSTEGERGKN